MLHIWLRMSVKSSFHFLTVRTSFVISYDPELMNHLRKSKDTLVCMGTSHGKQYDTFTYNSKEKYDTFLLILFFTFRWKEKLNCSNLNIS